MELVFYCFTCFPYIRVEISDIMQIVMKHNKKRVLYYPFIQLWVGCVFFLFIFSPNQAEAQLSRQDSLQQVLNKTDLDLGDRVFTLGRLATHHYFDDNKLQGDSLLEEAIHLASSLPDKQYLARTLAIQAMQLRIQGEQEASQTAIHASLKALETTENLSTKGYVLYAKGWLEARGGSEDKAVESFLTALKYYDKASSLTESDKTSKSTIYGELYSIYGVWRDYPQMEKYARLSLENARESGNKDALTGALYSFAYSFEERYRNAPKQSNLLDSAEYYYKESVSTFIQYQDQVSSRNQLPFNAIGLANLYAEFFPISYKDTAQVYLDIALEEGLNTKQYTTVASAYGIMNEYAQRENRWTDAEKYLLLSASYIQKEEIPSVETLARIMQSLSTVYEQKGDYKLALKYLKEYLELFETRFDNEKMAIGKELGVKYESELKEQKLQLLEEQVAHRQKLNTIYIVLTLVTVVALFFLWLAYRQRTKAYKHQSHIHYIELERIRQEHKISLLSAMIDGQENERARIARDLHDGLGGLLSGVKIMLSGSGELSSVTPQHTLISHLIQRIDQAVDELRRIARNMMPEILLKYGLIEALKEYSQSLKRSGVNITFQSYRYNDELTENKQVVVYRIAQELINNAIKYSEANHILVELRQEGSELSLLVEDDGKGFDIGKQDRHKGTGLNNVEARSVFLNGEIRIESLKGTGTTVVLTCPI